jgi:thioredoxin 1
LAAIVGMFVLLRNRPTRIGALDDIVGSRQPVIVEVFSNIWTPCLLAKPIVDGLEKDLEGQAQVVRLNILSEVGREAAGRYGVRSVPTFLIFDNEGTLIGREVGFPNRGRIESLVSGIGSQ